MAWMQALTNPSDDGEHSYSGSLKAINYRCGGGCIKSSLPFSSTPQILFHFRFDSLFSPSLSNPLFPLPILLNKSSLSIHKFLFLVMQQPQLFDADFHGQGTAGRGV